MVISGCWNLWKLFSSLLKKYYYLYGAFNYLLNGLEVRDSKDILYALPDLIKIQATQLNLNAGETEKKKKKERKKETGISISQILHGMYLY